MRLRFEEPRLFFASENNNDDIYNYDKELTGVLIKLMDRMKQFSIMTIKGDILNVTVSDQKCPFRIYELERLGCLKSSVDEFCSETSDLEGTKLEDDLKAVKDSIVYNHQHLKDYINASEKERKSIPGSHYFKKVETFMDSHFELGRQ